MTYDPRISKIENSQRRMNGRITGTLEALRQHKQQDYHAREDTIGLLWLAVACVGGLAVGTLVGVML